MAVIRANRTAIDDRFSVLGFTVQAQEPMYEIGLATDPDLLHAEHRARRTPGNFYTSRVMGGTGARRGESVFLVPPSVVARFVGQPRLYFGLATFRDADRQRPVSVRLPDAGSMYVSLSGLTERGLRRTVRSEPDAGYGSGGAVLAWGGDSAANPAASPRNGHTNGRANGHANAAAPAEPVPYSDGYSDDLWQHEAEAPAAAAPAAPAAPAQAPAPAPAAEPVATAQDLLLDPYYQPSDPVSALREQIRMFGEGLNWFLGVDDTSSFPHSAICAVRLSDGGEHGTAFYIGRNLLLTAAHVVEGQSELTIVPGKRGSGGGTEPFGRFTVTSADWVVHPSRRQGSSDFDMALVRTSQEAPNGAWFDLLEELRQSRPEGVVVCGYSVQSRGSRLIHRLVNRTIDGGKQHLHGGHVRTLTDETFGYDIQTLGGASGAPVYWIEDAGVPVAHLVGVHVAGESAETNRGCRLTDAKIGWIRGQQAAWGLPQSQSLALRARADAPSLRSASRKAGTVRVSPMSRGQSNPIFDVLPVDLKLRVFIPAPVAIVTVPVAGGEMPGQSAHGGDGRGFQAEGGTSRAEITARYNFGNGERRGSLSDVHLAFGESTNYERSDTIAVPGKPEWYRDLRPGAQPIERGRQTVSDSKLRVALGGSAFHGILSVAENAVVVTFDLHANDPIVTGSPDIDATLAVLIKVDGDRIKVRVNGGHDEFPAYELYANGHLVYSYDPVTAGGTPWGLFGDGVWDVNVDANYVDVGPATEYRLIGPVRAQGAPRALSIPLDPGVGGQSIGVDALSPGDIIVSTARHPVSYAIRAGTLSAISHAMLYVGDGRVVEAVGEGVREVALETAIGDAILAVAYRDPRVDAGTAASLVAFARAQVGQPYNYGGVARAGYRIVHPIAGRVLDAIRDSLGVDDASARSFFCSELVFAAFEAAGIPLVAQRADQGLPADLVQLSHGALAYVGHLRARDEVLGIALGAPPSPRRTASQALSGGADYPVPLIPQPNKDACWAAAMAMLLSWRRRASITPETLAREVGASLESSYDMSVLEDVRARYGFQEITQPSNTSLYHSPQQWADWLAAHGALWVVIVGAPHAVVVAGIRGDLANPAAVKVKVLNPWDTRVAFDPDPVAFNPANAGYEDWLPFADFAADFGNMAEPDYGNWRVLYLPEAAATAQSLRSRSHALSEGPADDDSVLEYGPPPPPVVRELRATRALDGGAGVAIASTIAGAVMERLANNEGDITWELDQLRGYKHPNDIAPSPMPPSQDGPVIRLTDWPWVDVGFLVKDRISAGFEINWQHNGKSVGNVMISNVATNDAIGMGLVVKAKIMDDNIVYPRSNPTFAALRVRFEYRFTHFVKGDKIAIRDIRLFGDGTYSDNSRWEQG
jgi:V8-like Glu-specific endopeptidase/cell wall-associated NlpC family hydrolase